MGGFLAIATVALCELLANPAAYDGKVVRVSGTYRAGFEHSFMACKTRTWVEFAPSFEKATPPRILRRLEEREPPECDGAYRSRSTEIRLTVVARFEASKVTGKLFGHELRSHFGHLNGYDSQLTILAVEDAGWNRAGKAVFPNPEEGKFTIPCATADRIPF